MENGGIWIPLTPGKPFPTSSRLNCDAALNSDKRNGMENINEAFPYTGSYNTVGYMEKCVMNEKCEFPAGIFVEDEAVLGCVAEKDPKSNTTVQNDTNRVQGETIHISPSDGKKALGVDESKAGFGSVPTPKSKYSRKRRTDDIDLNKKPNQRPRVKKHRPKVYDDSKPKKIPKVQTPRASTPKPKTPKPKTPKPVTPTQRKTKYTSSTSCGLENVGQGVTKAFTTSIVDVKLCKRSLNFEGLFDEESHDVSKLHEEHPRLCFDLGKCKIVTAKRNTPRKNRFQKNNLQTSKDLLRDTNEQKDISGVLNQLNYEQSQKKDKRYVYFYQRRKKRNLNITIVYQRRSFRENQCLHSSKKCGPIFPKIFKKQRSLRKKFIMRNSWYMKHVDEGKLYEKHSHRKPITRRMVSRMVKPDRKIDELDVRVFSPPTRNRSIRQSRLRVNIMDLLTFKEKPPESEKYLLCQKKENFLRIMDYPHPHPHYSLPQIMDYPLPQQELPIHKVKDFQQVDKSVDILNSHLQDATVHWIGSFTSNYKDFKEVDNSVGILNSIQVQEIVDVKEVDNSIGNMNSIQLQEVQVVESQSISQHVVLTQGDLHRMYVREILPYIIRKFASLDINGQRKELVARNIGHRKELMAQNFGQCKELLVRNFDVSGVLARIIPPKKRKEHPKVDLDHETLRVWKLLMENDGSEPVEEMNKDKEEWWERQREIFRGRVDSFIAKMHLIQGDRRFSPWKGSVTDSVVGAYLTQNVSDHLSSSAFMSVAARFPVISRNLEEFTSSQESVTSYANVEQRFSKVLEIEQDMSTSCADVSNATPTTEHIHDNPCVGGNINNFRRLLEIEEVDFLKQFCKADDDEPEETRSASFFSLPNSSSEPCATTSDLKVGLCQTSESELCGLQKSTPEKEPIVLTPFFSLQSEVTIEQENEFTGQLDSVPKELIPFTLLCNLQSEVTIEQKSEFAGQQKSTSKEKLTAFAPVCSHQSELTIEQGVSAVDNHRKMSETPLESGSTKKKQQEIKIDWEKFRRTYCKPGGKEINENYMDSVDWDAVRRAPHKELAETIAERGMNNVLAARIKDFLDRMYKDHGSHDLEWLRDVPPDKAKEFLLSIDGIGLKSVECIRLLTLHHLAFPVDTNVGRVATRLGWVPLQPLPGQLQIHLLNDYPMVDTVQKFLFPRLCTLDQKTLYELHYQLITFGKVFCTKRKPNCNACPMRGECRHYASEFASGRLALPAPKESSRVTSIVPATNEQNHSLLSTPSSSPSSFDPKFNNLGSSYHGQTCEPIIECPPSPEVEEMLIGDIEDLCCDSDDEIPSIRLNIQEFRETLNAIGANNLSLPEADISKALVTSSAQAAKVHVPVKIVARLRTMHLVYEIPDCHPILAEFDRREHDDPTPYLLKIWLPGEILKSLDQTENRACDSDYTNEEDSLKGTIFIPCRTANRGSFPLNGTYFQVNEVFADDETSVVPIDVPKSMLWSLPRRELGCGSSATSIFKGLPTHVIQRLFWRGSICVRGYSRKTRRPQALDKKLHATTTMTGENKKSGKR